MAKKKIAILTGGGDAPGLNAVIYSIVRTCLKNMDCELIGYMFGYRGLYNNDFMELTAKSTSGILHKGGTILACSNKDNLFNYAVKQPDGSVRMQDVSHVAVENMKKEGVDVLVVLGGDGTLTSARDFARLGVNVIGVPKTIDNDLSSTDATFGFDTAVNIVVENLGRLHTTAESHHRIMVVEVMGRSAGWIALHSGISGSADVILIPEIPYSIDKVVEKVRERDAEGKLFTMIVVTEGAAEKGGTASIGKIVADSPDKIRFGGIAERIADQLEKMIPEHEVRHVTLGHIQRGGEPSPADRLLSARYGVAAANLICEGKFGNMVCLRNGVMSHVPLEDVIGSAQVSTTGAKLVRRTDELVKVAKNLGISFAEAE